MKQIFFVEAFLLPNRASRAYQYFIDTFKIYSQLFEGLPDITALLSVPYPLYNDLILSKLKDNEREKKLLKEKTAKNAFRRG